RRRVRVHDLEPAVRLDLKRLEVAHRPRPVLAVLAEALVELAAHGAGHVGDDAVEGVAADLGLVETVVDQRTQHPSRLRATVGVDPACARRGLGAFEPRGAVAQRDEAEPDDLRAGARVGEGGEPSLRETVLEPDVMRIGRDTTVYHAREL